MIIASGNGGCQTPTPTGAFGNVLQPTTNLISEFDPVRSAAKPEIKATLVDNYFLTQQALGMATIDAPKSSRTIASPQRPLGASNRKSVKALPSNPKTPAKSNN